MKLIILIVKIIADENLMTSLNFIKSLYIYIYIYIHVRYMKTTNCNWDNTGTKYLKHS
jgi:hypothetical protein